MNYYFVSDVHLGLSDGTAGCRSDCFVAFLREIRGRADGLYLLGDIFDFWVEYPDEIPSGYDEVLSELKILSDSGCRIIFFKGNHDYWTLDYFERELGIEVASKPYRVEVLNGLSICVGHGDVLGCTSTGAKIIFHLFRNPLLIKILRAFPRRLIKKFGHWWSARSRKGSSDYVFELAGSDILNFAESLEKESHIDHFIFGHFHKRVSRRMESGSFIHILGDWRDGQDYLNLSGMKISGRGLPNTVI